MPQLKREVPAEAAPRASCRPTPAVYIHGAALSSVFGRNAAETLEALHAGLPLAGRSAPPDFADPSPAVAALLAQARRTSALSPFENSKAIAEMLECAEPLAREARAAGIKAEDLALIAGTSTAGLSETIARVGKGDDAPQAWLPMALGRAAPLAASLLGIAGPAYVLSTACTAGAKAIAEAARLLASDRVEAAIAGGLDAANPLTEAGFTALGARTPKGSLPFCEAREGLALGPGGGFLLLSKRPSLAGRPALARLAGWGETSDAHHISAPDPEGAGALDAMRLALKRAALQPEDIDFIILHGTGTKQNDAMESKAVHALFGDSTPAASLKRAVGHQLAGAGAFSAAVAYALLAAVREKGEAPLPLNAPAALARDPALPPLELVEKPCSRPLRRILVNAFAFGGSNISLIIEAAANEPDRDEATP